MNFNFMNLYVPCLPFYRLSLSCQLIQLFSVNFQGRVHGRNLRILSLKGLNRLIYFFNRRCNLSGFQDFSRYILGIRNLSQKQDSPISLVPIRKKLTYFGCFSQAHWKHAFRIRVQRTCMPNSLLPQDSPEPGNHVVRSISFLFIYINNSVNHRCFLPYASSCLSICSVRLFITSWKDPCIVQPAARTWPPPPK